MARELPGSNSGLDHNAFRLPRGVVQRFRDISTSTTKGNDSRGELVLSGERSTPEREPLRVIDSKRFLYRSGIAMQDWGEVGNALISLGTGQSDLPPYGGLRWIKPTYERVSQQDDPVSPKAYKLRGTMVSRTDPPPPLSVVRVDPILQSLIKGSRPYERQVVTEPITQIACAVTPVPADSALLFEIVDQPGIDRKEIEGGLARLFTKEQERGHIRRDVYVLLGSGGDQVSIDFDQVVERIQPVLQRKGLGKEILERVKSKKSIGERMAEHFTAVDSSVYPVASAIHPGEPLAHPFKLGTVDGIEISLSLAMVGDRVVTDSDSDASMDRWNAQGSVLTVPVLEHPQGEGYIYPPILVISVHRPSVDINTRTQIIPVLDPQAKERMKELSLTILNAFREE